MFANPQAGHVQEAGMVVGMLCALGVLTRLDRPR